MRNLDQLAAKTAQAIVNAIQDDKSQDAKAQDAKALDTLATRTLGVLQENGVYACVLFLDSRSNKEREMARKIREQLAKTLGADGLALKQPNDDVREWLANHLASNLDNLLLVKSLWEQTLIYVRYGAKAKAAAQKPKTQEKQA
ncbi:MAG: hypothetical protein NZL98_05775 [Anaerolineales bacterium]|nr:hypothetical protein [Anaerolineales bacterium]